MKFYSSYYDLKLQEQEIEYRKAERQSARLTIVERVSDSQVALTLLQMLGLDTLDVPRSTLPLKETNPGKPLYKSKPSVGT